jgi:hypothetical protein
MTARAYVADDYLMDGVAVYLTEKLGDGRRILAEPVDLVFTVAPPEATAPAGPTFRLREDHARALLDALTAHFGGAPEVQTLRKDYMAERTRVDKMIDHLIGGGR